jgi:hypothetical protein
LGLGGEITGGWRIKYKGKFNVSSSSNTAIVMRLKRIRWADYIARMEDLRNECKVLIWNPQRKKPRCILEDSVTMDLKNTVY